MAEPWGVGNPLCCPEVGGMVDSGRPELVPVFGLNVPVSLSAMIVRFLTKRFIGDYEPNTG